MKSPYHSTDPQEGPTPQQIAAWSLILRQWQSRLAPFFARPEVLQHALLYLQAILSDIPRKNGWQIAEHARQARPYDEVGGQRGVAIPSDLSNSFLTVS